MAGAALLIAQVYVSWFAMAQKFGSSTANDTLMPAPLMKLHWREYILVASSTAEVKSKPVSRLSKRAQDAYSSNSNTREACTCINGVSVKQVEALQRCARVYVGLHDTLSPKYGAVKR